MESISAATGRPTALHTIGLGGLAIGILDFIDASTFFPLYYGIGFIDVWQVPAAGLVGFEATRNPGFGVAILGISAHFLVAFCIAAVYYIFSRRIPLMVRLPIISGIGFGIAAYFVMQYVIIPYSAIGRVPIWPRTPALLNGIVGHALLVGLPVALIARWSACRNRKLA